MHGGTAVQQSNKGVIHTSSKHHTHHTHQIQQCRWCGGSSSRTPLVNSRTTREKDAHHVKTQHKVSINPAVAARMGARDPGRGRASMPSYIRMYGLCNRRIICRCSTFRSVGCRQIFYQETSVTAVPRNHMTSQFESDCPKCNIISHDRSCLTHTQGGWMYINICNV